MAEIVINGKKLSDIQLLLEPYPNCGESYLSYPSKAYRVNKTDLGIDIWIPARIAFELYRRKIIDSDFVEIEVEKEINGSFKIIEVRHPQNSDSMYHLTRFKFQNMDTSSSSTF